jgi:serine kinase
MQYAENGSILDLIHNTKYLKEATACKYFKQLISAVEYLHSLGICHRDLKCENILLDRRNTIKIIDFGFGKILNKSDTKTEQEKKIEKLIEAGVDSPPVTERRETSGSTSSKKKDPLLSETYCGSYAYASPEILKGTPYDPRKSDIWALGVVLFAMVFGRLPFDDRDVKQLLKQVESALKFPNSPSGVSDACKNLLKGILGPLRYRFTIEDIKNHPWMTKFDVENQTAE